MLGYFVLICVDIVTVMHFRGIRVVSGVQFGVILECGQRGVSGFSTSVSIVNFCIGGVLPSAFAFALGEYTAGGLLE